MVACGILMLLIICLLYTSHIHKPGKVGIVSRSGTLTYEAVKPVSYTHLLLLDQAFLAGLGNYLRVEILWQVGLSGKRKAAELSDSQLDEMCIRDRACIPRYRMAAGKASASGGLAAAARWINRR